MGGVWSHRGVSSSDCSWNWTGETETRGESWCAMFEVRSVGVVPVFTLRGWVVPVSTPPGEGHSRGSCPSTPLSCGTGWIGPTRPSSVGSARWGRGSSVRVSFKGQRSSSTDSDTGVHPSVSSRSPSRQSGSSRSVRVGGPGVGRISKGHGSRSSDRGSSVRPRISKGFIRRHDSDLSPRPPRPVLVQPDRQGFDSSSSRRGPL